MLKAKRVLPMTDSHEKWRAAIAKILSEGKADTALIASPEVPSTSARRFFDDLRRTHSVIGLLTFLTLFADKFTVALKQINSALAKKSTEKHGPAVENDANAAEPPKSSAGEVSMYLKALDRVGPIVLQMIIVRTADNFTSYLSEIIRECLRAQPNLLRSKETMTYDDILEFSDLDELRNNLVDRKVNDLAYRGFEKLSQWFDERLGISELQSCVAWRSLVELLETRNCIVHNCCRASAKYLRAIGDASDSPVVRRPILITPELAFLSYCATAECVTVLDEVIAKKFRLSRQPLLPEQEDDQTNERK